MRCASNTCIQHKANERTQPERIIANFFFKFAILHSVRAQLIHLDSIKPKLDYLYEW